MIRRSGNVVGNTGDSHAADAPQCDDSFSVLSGLFGVGGRNRFLGPSNRTKVFLNHRQGFGFVQATADKQNHVIGSIKLFIKGAQIIDGNSFNVGTIADGRFAVIMPFVSGSHHSLFEHRFGVVFSHLKFISHHGHFAGEFFSLDGTIHQAIGFVPDRPFQIVVPCGHCLVVIGPIDPGCAVVVGATRLQVLIRAGMSGGRLEQHVFQQVCHSRFAVSLVPRTNEHSHIDGDLVFRRFREKHHFQPVIELVFGKSLDRTDFSGLGRLRGLDRQTQHRQTDDHPLPRHESNSFFQSIPIDQARYRAIKATRRRRIPLVIATASGHRQWPQPVLAVTQVMVSQIAYGSGVSETLPFRHRLHGIPPDSDADHRTSREDARNERRVDYP